MLYYIDVPEARAEDVDDLIGVLRAVLKAACRAQSLDRLAVKELTLSYHNKGHPIMYRIQYTSHP